MKRIILVLVIILISTNTLHAKEFNWTDKMKTISEDTEFYIDKKSIRRVENYVYYWSLANYLKYKECQKMIEKLKQVPCRSVVKFAATA